MEKTQASNFIRDVFTQPFDRERFRQFVHELLNRYDASKSHAMLVPDAFTQHVKSCQRLGTYQSPCGELLDILIVNVAEDYKIERTRTALRDFVAHKLKRDDSYKEAALVAFVPPSLKNWRFSYVRMEYETTRDPKTGKIKPEERLTPARRYSYLVGVDEKSHTAQKQLLSLLETPKNKQKGDPELSAIEQSFSVEKVTKEFFSEYSRLFEATNNALTELVKKDKTLRADFEAKHVDTVAFAKKLLGQIVFLYFIQKKGWLGVPKNGKWGDGLRDFLRHLANKAIREKKNIFNDILEPLFYDTLAYDRGHEAWCKIFQCRIPFLNGGLFEPLAGYDWENTEINFPNSLFTNQERSSQGDTGTGILDVFDRYNFTVNEAEPLEKEVAIDPEMLGKVFENLLEENRRKGLGAFYTPREIVHYMCQESLINYLDTGLSQNRTDALPAPSVIPAKAGIQKSERKITRKELEEWIHKNDQFSHYESAIAAGTKEETYKKYRPPETIQKYAREIDALLRDILVCDPAIGSGAFPVGMMMEIVRARMALTPYFNDIAERTPYYFKWHAIQNSLYGVDIDPGAVEIAKLRLWLSLVVDEDDIKQIKPLPNLDYKIMQGNSLLDEYQGIKLFDENLITDINETENNIKVIKDKQRQLEKELLQLHSQNQLTRQIKKTLQEQSIRLNKTLKQTRLASANKDPNVDWVKDISARKKKADLLKAFHQKFFSVFDKNEKEKLRNSIDSLEWELIEATLVEQNKKTMLAELEGYKKANVKPFFLWKLHFPEVFHAKGGFDVVIANPPYLFARNSEEKGLTAEAKRYFYKNYTLAEYQVNLYPLFIERADRLLTDRGTLTFITPNNWLTINTNKTLRGFVLGRSSILIVNFYARVFETADVDSAILIYEKGQHNPHVRLLEYTDTFHEIKSAPTSFFASQRESIINVEMFKGSGGELDIITKIETNSIPLNRIADVKSGLKAYEVGKGIPAQTKAMKDQRIYHARTKRGAEWIPYLQGKDVCRYALAWSGKYLHYGENLAAPRKDFRLFSTKRILVRQIPNKPPYCIHGCYADDTLLNDLNSLNVINIKAESLAILAVLNSRLISFWFALKFGKLQRGLFPQFKANELADFPISKKLSSYEKQLADLAHKATQKRREDASADIGQIDREIDRLVYELYGMTKEEIEIVENHGAIK